MPTQPGFFRLHCHFGEKTGHIMVETAAGGSGPLAAAAAARHFGFYLWCLGGTLTH